LKQVITRKRNAMTSIHFYRDVKYMPVVSVSHAENSVLYVSVCSCVCTIALFPFYTDDSESLSVCDLFEQGEAKSAELIGQAIANNPAFLALRQIEAAREISHTMAASSNKVFLDSRDLLLGLQQLNVGGKQKK